LSLTPLCSIPQLDFSFSSYRPAVIVEVANGNPNSHDDAKTPLGKFLVEVWIDFSYAPRIGSLLVGTHTGQESKGYAKRSRLSRMGYEPGLASWENRRGSEERAAAATLLARRRREIRLEW
jgi:hypothetical protein